MARQGWARPLPLLIASIPLWVAGCGAPSPRVLTARRLEPQVRAALESYAARARPAPARHGVVSLLLTAEGAAAPAGPPGKGGPPGEPCPGVQQRSPRRKEGCARGRPEIVVSTGVPFAPGVLRDPALLALRDQRGAAVPIQTAPLATWPLDRSIRSVLVVFHASLKPGEQAIYTLEYGAPESGSGKAGGPGAALVAPHAAAPGPLSPNPDGPIAATLPPSWYAQSLVSGPQQPVVDDSRFPGFESGIERGLTAMSPAYDSYGVSCSSRHRTYYDGPHALYQRFLRNGDAPRFRRARAEAAWYRQHELTFSPDRSLAVHVCQKAGWTPRAPLSWEVLRRLLGQGMLDDYLLTGDPAAKEAVVAMGEAVRRDLTALTSGREDVLLATERNMAWVMMTLSSYYAVEPRPDLREALHGLMGLTAAWQERGSSGAFEHDLTRADPSECERGPRGGSPFMTALLVDALMDYHALTGDTRVRGVVERAATWLAERAITSDRRAFRYLWGCETDPYDDSGTADLNLLIVPVFGAAYALTREARWLAVGDGLADIGVREMRVRQPKQWNQAMRGFGRYLGYRAQAFAPPRGGAQAAR